MGSHDHPPRGGDVRLLPALPVSRGARTKGRVWVSLCEVCGLRLPHKRDIACRPLPQEDRDRIRRENASDRARAEERRKARRLQAAADIFAALRCASGLSLYHRALITIGVAAAALDYPIEATCQTKPDRQARSSTRSRRSVEPESSREGRRSR